MLSRSETLPLAFACLICALHAAAEPPPCATTADLAALGINLAYESDLPSGSMEIMVMMTPDGWTGPAR